MYPMSGGELAQVILLVLIILYLLFFLWCLRDMMESHK